MCIRLCFCVRALLQCGLEFGMEMEVADRYSNLLANALCSLPILHFDSVFYWKSRIIANTQIKWVHHQYSGSVLFPINWAYFHIKLYPQAKRPHDICAWCNCIYSGLWKLAREIWIIWILWMYNLHVSNARLKIETQFPHRYYWTPLRLNGLCDFDVISSEFHVKKNQNQSQISLDHRIL